MDSLMIAIMLSIHSVPVPVVRNVAIKPPECVASIPMREETEIKAPNVWDMEGGTDER